jgi:hypothetical protein
VKALESGARVPIANNMLAIKAALELAGIWFATDSIGGPIKGRSAPTVDDPENRQSDVD